LGSDVIDVKLFDQVMPHLRVPDLASYDRRPFITRGYHTAGGALFTDR
jgi:hypothetical protein